MKNEYPYQNLSLEDMEGEVWEDVPGFDGAYHISNYGRVKSLRRWRGTGYGGYYTKDRIRKPGLSSSDNMHLKEKVYSLGITLKMDGKVRSTAVAKLVYYIFVSPFEIDNPELLISFKDHDGRNVKPNNLILTNRSAIHKRSHKLKRARSYWAGNKLPVKQLTMDGKLIASYKSIMDAAEKNGFSLSAIAECTKGNISQHKGFKWQLVNDRVTTVTKKKHEPFNDYLWQKIGKPKTSKRHPIPVLNLSKENLKDEKWKPIEGLEDNYMISSLGRVKSISRFKKHKVWLKEHISKLVPDGNQNRETSSLLASLNKEGRKYQQSVGRLVYYHFVEKFDLSDKMIKIYFKDNCFYNLDYKNLQMKYNAS
jgi:hypothetical protein